MYRWIDCFVCRSLSLSFWLWYILCVKIHPQRKENTQQNPTSVPLPLSPPSLPSAAKKMCCNMKKQAIFLRPCNAMRWGVFTQGKNKINDDGYTEMMKLYIFLCVYVFVSCREIYEFVFKLTWLTVCSVIMRKNSGDKTQEHYFLLFCCSLDG